MLPGRTNPPGANLIVDNNITGGVEEKVQVDRRLLEQLITGNSRVNANFTLTAEDFFNKVMCESHTVICWPTRLKIGAKTKKDPHVKLFGLPECVAVAKEKILALLKPPQRRVALKMDISFTDHSHIIGRRGQNTQEVMKATGCHIHFPDSNRDPDLEKSNQVSISGPLESIDRARLSLRSLSPLVLSFALADARLLPAVLAEHKIVQNILHTHGVTVGIRSDRHLNRPHLAVRGSDWQESQVKDATERLQHIFGTESDSNVMTTVEVTQQHQTFVLGPDNSHVRAISVRSGAQIRHPHGSIGSQTTFVLSGTADSILTARRQLIACLPLVMIFELPSGAKLHNIATVEVQLGLQISLKTKRNGDGTETASVIVRGPESRANDIYQVRNYFVPQPTTTENSAFMAVESYGTNAFSSDTFGCPTASINVRQFELVNTESSLPTRLNADLISSTPEDFNSQQHGDVPPSPLATALRDSAAKLSEKCEMDTRAVGAERHCSYEEVKLSALRAKHNRPRGLPRVPNAEFVGFGFSASLPACGFSQLKSADSRVQMDSTLEEEEDKIGPWRLDPPGNSDRKEPDWPSLAASAYFDAFPTGPVDISGREDLPELLANLRLTQYADLFRANEIEDLETFASLSDLELKEIGVKADWSRRRLLYAISVLRNQRGF